MESYKRRVDVQPVDGLILDIFEGMLGSFIPMIGVHDD